MANKTNNQMLSQNSTFLKKAFNKHLIPSMITTLGYTLNVLLDGIIVGQKLGAAAFTAVNVCMPIYLFLCTIGSLIGNGCFILSSRKAGEGDYEGSNRVFNTAFLLMFIFSGTITAVGIFLSRPISVLLCDGVFNQDVFDYARVTLCGSMIKMFYYIPVLYLLLDGKSKWASVSSVVMTVSNVLLDLLLVVKLNLGLRGAAMASVLATLTALTVGLVALFIKSSFRLNFKFAGIKTVPQILRYGSTSAVNNLMSSLRVLLINTAFMNFNNLNALAIFSVLNNVSELSLCIVDGVPTTAEPLMAIYSAERSNNGIKITMKYQMKIGAIMSAVFAVLAVIFSNQIGSLFGLDFGNETVSPLIGPFICFAVALLIAFALRTLILYYNASGQNVLSGVLTALRLVVFPVGLLYLMLALNFTDFWVFWPVAELLTAVVLIAVLNIIQHKNNKRTKYLLLDIKSSGDEKALEFSVSADEEAICGSSSRVSEYFETVGVSPKIAMRLSLSIEEMLIVMKQKSFTGKADDSFDLRVFVSEEKKGIRIRCLGKKFNPMAKTDEFDTDEYMGIKMISELTQDITYSYVYGVNNLIILL